MATSYTNLYVDTDIGSAGDGTSWAQAKGGLGAALALLDANTTDCVVHCKGSAADGVANIGTTDMAAGKRLTIRTDAADRHHGAYSASHYRLEYAPDAGSGQVMSNEWNLVTLDGLQFKISGSAYPDEMCVRLLDSGARSIIITSCIFNAALTADATGSYGLVTANATSGTLDVYNCVFQNFKIGNSTLGGAIIEDSGTFVATFSNCTFAANGFGLRNVGNCSVVAKNCYADCSAGWAGYAYYGVITKTTCASSDSTGTAAGLRNIACSTTADSTHAGFTNVAAGSEDFHLGAGSPLLGVGADLSATFTTDIDGETRPASWSIGADDIPADVESSLSVAALSAYIVAVSGTYAGTAPTHVEYQVGGAGAWTTIGGESIGGGAWSGTVTVSEGSNAIVFRKSNDTGTTSDALAVVVGAASGAADLPEPIIIGA